MPKPNVLLTMALVILLFNASAGQPILLENDNVTANLIKGHSRKILTEIQDYDYGGANSRHDPRRRPGRNG